MFGRSLRSMGAGASSLASPSGYARMDILRERVNVLSFISLIQRRIKMIVRVASVTCFALLLCQPAFADEPSYTRHRHRYYSAPPLMSLNLLHRLTAAGLSSTAFATTVSRLLVCAGSPANPSGLSLAVGSAIATTPRFTTCPRAPLARHCVGAARGGEGRLAESFRATWNAARVSFVRC
jgi:hypothetical protein